ncbi:MAG: glycosyltransferase [Acidimicrobiales bacterium]
MHRLTLVTPDLPYPPNGGSKIKSYFLLKRLVPLFDVSLVSVLKGDDADHVAGLREDVDLSHVEVAPVDRPRNIKNLALSYAQRRTLNEFRTWSPELAERAVPLLEDSDVIVADHLETVQYVPEHLWERTVNHTHNAEHVLWRRYSNVSAARLTRLVALSESRRIGARELEYGNGCGATLAAPADQSALKELGVEGDRLYCTYHIGDDSFLDLPDVEWAGTEELVFFLGTLTWEANIDGLTWFLDDVWPQVVSERPNARFVIGGKNPPPELLRRVDALDSVDAVGFVDDPETFLEKARVVVAPLRFGSGMKLKVTEALMRGVPTVTTNVGVESIDAVDGVHLEVADDPAEAASRIVGLLTDEQRWTAMRDHARELARRLYTWDVVASDANAAINSVIAR